MSSSIDVKDLRSALIHDGFVVVPGAVPNALCEAVLQAMGQELGVWIDDPSTWDRVSHEIDQVPLWGHQSLWDIRQLPNLYELWTAIWGTDRLWVDRNSCRFTPPWRADRADALALHWDLDPRDRNHLWYQGIVALTDAGLDAGGFCCAPSVMLNRQRWPTSWPVGPHGTEYRPDPVAPQEVVEVPLRAGDLIVFDNHLPHGTVRNRSATPRAAFYVQMFPAGTPEEAAVNIAAHDAGTAPSWWRWKPGHDRAEPGPATLTDHGRRLLGMDRAGSSHYDDASAI